MNLIDRMYNVTYRYKILESFQVENMYLNVCIDFLPQAKKEKQRKSTSGLFIDH